MKSNIIKIVKNIVYVTVLTTALSACSSPSTTNIVSREQSHSASVYNQMLQQKLVQERRLLVSDLTHNKVQVSLIGETAQLSIPSGQLFNGRSANFTAYGKSLVSTINEYIGSYKVINLYIRSYADSSIDKATARSLTANQAQVMLNSVHESKLDVRYISAEGMGMRSPIVSNLKSPKSNINNRITISWMFLPKYNDQNG